MTDRHTETQNSRHPETNKADSQSETKQIASQPNKADSQPARDKQSRQRASQRQTKQTGSQKQTKLTASQPDTNKADSQPARDKQSRQPASQRQTKQSASQPETNKADSQPETNKAVSQPARDKADSQPARDKQSRQGRQPETKQTDRPTCMVWYLRHMMSSSGLQSCANSTRGSWTRRAMDTACRRVGGYSLNSACRQGHSQHACNHTVTEHWAALLLTVTPPSVGQTS